tara:strand:+ start:58 stop:630 length:573 start_codon:yes stop_codon:yes gene_type:complete
MDNKHKIVNHLGKNIERSYTMHKLSKLLHIPYASFYRTIQKMKDLLIIETVGKSKTIKLNKNNPVVKAHLIVASDEERKEFLKKNKIIKLIAKELDTKDVVVLFGSYAKGKHTDRSDIDFLIINRDGKKSLSFSKFELLYKKEINPMFITKQEFKNMLKDKEENVGKQALKGHVILNNPEGFWGYVLNGI